MNAREAMQAMIDGKTVRASNGTLMKLSKDGEELTDRMNQNKIRLRLTDNESVTLCFDSKEDLMKGFAGLMKCFAEGFPYMYKGRLDGYNQRVVTMLFNPDHIIRFEVIE